MAAQRSESVTVLGHPPGLFLLFIVEMWERFSYYGMRALLVLYLTSQATSDNPGRGWSEGNAYQLYGLYTGLAYLLPLFGGLLADKFLGTHRSMLVGAVLITLGHIVLGVTGIGTLEFSDMGMSLFIGGLVLIIIGTGYFKPCVSVMVGQLYSANDPRREGAYTIFYMGINVGAFICAFICGTLGEMLGWHWGFGSAAVGMILGLICYLLGKPTFLKGIGEPPPGRSNTTGLFFLLSLALCAGATVLWHLGQGGAFASLAEVEVPEIVWLLLRYGIPVALALLIVWFIASQDPGDKGPTATIFIVTVFNAFFWMAFEQAGSTLNVFALNDTDRNLFGFEIPATWFQSVNPLLIILLAPLFAGLWTFLGRRGLDPSQPVKIGIALLLVGLGYVVIVMGSYVNYHQGVKVSMMYLVGLYFLHTVGELFISPTGLSFVARTAPVRFVSLLMGVYFISSALANYGGGYIASYVEEFETGRLALPWSLGGRADFFMLFVATSVGASLLVFVLTPFIKMMMRPEPGANGQKEPLLNEIAGHEGQQDPERLPPS